MKLWRVSQDENSDYDTYDSAVVAAESEEDARKVHPNGPNVKWGEKYGKWCSSPDKVAVEYIGEAKDGTEAGAVICASFNAG